MSVKPALHWRQNDISAWCFYSLGSLNYDYKWKHTCRSAEHKWSPWRRLWEVLLHASPLFAFNTSSAQESLEMSLPPASDAFHQPSCRLGQVSCFFTGTPAFPGECQLLPDTQASPHPYPCWAHPTLPSPVFQTKISQLCLILAFLTWNLPQAHFHTPPRRCFNSIIGELCRRFWMQWHKLEGKPSCCVAK